MTEPIRRFKYAIDILKLFLATVKIVMILQLSMFTDVKGLICRCINLYVPVTPAERDRMPVSIELEIQPKAHQNYRADYYYA